MADQLQEMLQKIYTEGVDKAKAEADIILENARAQSDKIKAEASAEAEKIIADAKKKAEELEKNINSDLKMASQQVMSSLKHKITTSLFNETIGKTAQEALQDVTFLQKLILEILGKWSHDAQAVIVVPQNKQKDLEGFFRDSVSKVFSGTLKIDYSPLMANGFSISPGDGSYKLSFTDEDFANFFQSFLRPKAAQILFGE